MLAPFGLAGASALAASVGQLLPQEVPQQQQLSAMEGCECRVDEDSRFLFYNRVPKCGSTTMLHMMNALAEPSDGWTGYNFWKSQDFSEADFDPDYDTRRGIVQDYYDKAMAVTANHSHGGKGVFERHLHFIDFREFQVPNPGYINLLRSPGDLVASSFYFYRDCVCNQRPAEGHDYADEWCKADWNLKSDEFCSEDINTCFADDDAKKRCTDQGHSMGGSELADFICGATSDKCKDPGSDQISDGAENIKWNDLFEAKVTESISNLKDHYHWMGVLEELKDSFVLLKHLLPNFFGPLDTDYWSGQDISPDGGDGHANDDSGHPSPSEAALATMARDPYFRMDLRLYTHAKELLHCKMQACGLSPSSARASNASSASSEAQRRAALAAEVRADRSVVAQLLAKAKFSKAANQPLKKAAAHASAKADKP